MSDRDQNNDFRGQSGQGREQDNTGNLAHGYGDGGDTPFGQLTQGASNRADGGFGGDSVGGYGQQGLNSQAGQGGVGPMTQGAGYGQGGGQFGPAGRDSQSGQAPYGAEPDHRSDYRAQGGLYSGQGRPEASGAGYYGGNEGSYAQQDFSPAAQRSKLHEDQRYTGPGANTTQASGGTPHHDDHEPHYRQWRDTQLAAHDRDYARWREEQTRKYDQDYRGWRGERHTAFSQEFEGWRANRGGQFTGSAKPPEPTMPNVDAAHGANPALASIADGHAGGTHHEAQKADKAD
jgi:hypothetical protein